MSSWHIIILSIWYCFLGQYFSLGVFIPDSYDEKVERDYRAQAGSKPISFKTTRFNGQWPKPAESLFFEERSIKDGEIPQYVIDHCPLVHLYSEEEYLPYDIAEFVKHFDISDRKGRIVYEGPLDINVDFVKLQGQRTRSLYFSSRDNVDSKSKWLMGHRPDYGTGYISKAPAVLIVIDKGNGWVDAYWFYFYAFNLGPYITGTGTWGSHLGDWEHSLVRFWNGEPQYLWMSAHDGGSGYMHSAVEKKDHWKVVNGKIEKSVLKRPLIFSAMGTHANYASVGQHAHHIPLYFNPLSDFTDRGSLWDPSMNFYGYTYNGTSVTSHNEFSRDIGTAWLYYEGHWGDKKLHWGNSIQRWLFSQWKYKDGPLGPLKKNLVHKGLCERSNWWSFWQGCTIRRMIKSGQGFDAERNDLTGDNCGVALYKVHPKWLRSILRLVTWRGFFCTLMDYFTG